MYILFAGASLKIVRNLIQATGMRECWAPFLEKSGGNVDKEKLLKEILGLNACNLSQSMKETSVDREIDAEDRQDLLDDYIVENLRLQDWITLRDGADRMAKCQEIEGVWERLRPHFNRTREAQGFKPRLEAVRDVMRHLGTGIPEPFEEALLEFVESQHRLFTGYFQALLEPFSKFEEDLPAGPEPLVEPLAQAGPSDPGEPKAAVEPQVRVESEVPVELKVPAQAPPVEPIPSLEEKGSVEPSPLTEALPEAAEISLPDPTDRLSQLPETEESLLGEKFEPEEEAPFTEPLPSEPLLPSEAVSPIAASLETEPTEAPESLKEPVPEIEASPLMEPPLPAERPLPPAPMGFARTVDPKKLAKVLEILLSIDPKADIKPISSAPIPPPPPPEEPPFAGPE
jgi:hypothetical protein